jgi:CheY-like chemotaxis protein
VIYAESAVGVGTTFRVYLPLSVDEIPSEPAIGPPPVTILVAEDEPIVRDWAVRVLHSAGYRTLAVADGQEAVAAVAGNENISLVVLDLVMPRLTGREVYERIKEQRPEIPILLCTGYDRQARPPECISRDGFELLEKPFRPSELLFTVSRMLGRPTTAPSTVLTTVA